MKLACLMIAIACAAASPASAEKVYVGPKGGLSCENPQDLLAMIERKMKGEEAGMGASCTTIAASSVIEATKIESLTDQIAAGFGSIDGGKATAFVVWRDVLPPVDANRTFKRVSPNDVRNTPTKWRGRNIEFANVQVYWVASDDVRIITSANMTLFATSIKSADASFFSKECETEDEALSRKCRANVRFRYLEHSEDTPSGLMKRTVLTSNDVELIRSTQPERRRR